MRTLKVIRVSEYRGATLGVLLLEDKPLCLTLEPPWKENAPQISCIPSGSYIASPHTSPRHGKTLEVENVLGRSEILFHKGNTTRDTQGCILLGTSFSFSASESFISNSTLAFKIFLSEIHPSESFNLEVLDTKPSLPLH